MIIYRFFILKNLKRRRKRKHKKMKKLIHSLRLR